MFFVSALVANKRNCSGAAAASGYLNSHPKLSVMEVTVDFDDAVHRIPSVYQF